MKKNKEATIVDLVQEGVKEIIIREGAPLPFHEQEKVALSGIIKAPGDFFENRKEDIEQSKAHVIFTKSKGAIRLTIDEENFFKTIVEGELVENPIISELGINKKKLFTPADLAQTLKMNRIFFDEPGNCMKTIENLQKAKASASIQIEKEQQNNGTVKDNFECKIDTSIDLKFELLLPVFIGYHKTKVEVEICIDIRGRAINLWLESVELAEILVNQADKIITDELKRFDNVVCIEQA